MDVLDQALASGATVVTPNNRLAREVAARFDAKRRAAGFRAWPAASVLPWTRWLERCWHAVLAAGIDATPRTLFGDVVSRELWHSIVARDRSDLLDTRGAAARASAAWKLFHAWRDADERIAGAADAQVPADFTVFARWAERYRSRLDSLHALDAAQLPDVLTRYAERSPALTAGRTLLHGFLAFTPQQQRLVDALRTAGATIDGMPSANGSPASCRRVACATPRDEIAQALTQARAWIAGAREARVAIVIADLDARRSDVAALAEEILCPDALLALPADAPRPYGISLGEPLASVPLVASALDLIAIGCGRVDAGVAASLLRSPFLPDAALRWSLRADAERRFAKLGQRTATWNDALRALRDGDAALHQRYAALVPPSREARLPRDWAGAWSQWLDALGWPGTATLSSAQWQAREAWLAALATFASIGTATGPLSPASAFEALRALLTDTLFQPEAEPASIQILGILEAAGLSFDCGWLAGFDARRWPEAAAPNPFLALHWQRAHRVPKANAEIALAHARVLTSALTAIAPTIIVSHARMRDDAPASISPLFEHHEPLEAAAITPRRFTQLVEPAALLRWSEREARPVVAGTLMRGGASLLESQSACAFQAFARYRLRAETWSGCPEGLSPIERGNVLHATLKAFWDDVGDQSALLALDPPALALRIAAAVEAGKAKLPPARWRALAPAVARGEATRLQATLGAWIDGGERDRPPFRVRAHEAMIPCDIDGLALRVRIDRIDDLEDGGLAIIDYKSGRIVRPARWFDERPEGIQLAVYARALEPTTDEPIRALAYAQVRAGEIAVAGVAQTSSVWPALDASDGARPVYGDWADVQKRLAERVTWLAGQVRSGIATVAPRDRTTCQYCGLQPLCRIPALDDAIDAASSTIDE